MLADKVNNLIYSLSFDGYVLIDCLKFSKTESTEFEYMNSILNFIALTDQGFSIIVKELLAISESGKMFVKCDVKLYDNQLVIIKEGLTFVVKYTTTNIKDLINSPSLDFYKCYYDGHKIHTTPEAIECHKTGNVQYVGNPVLLSRLNIYDILRCKFLKFKNEFLEHENVQLVAKLGKSFAVETDICSSIGVMLGTCYKSKYIMAVNVTKPKDNKMVTSMSKLVLKNPMSSLC
jgi:hypothetical protein